MSARTARTHTHALIILHRIVLISSPFVFLISHNYTLLRFGIWFDPWRLTCSSAPHTSHSFCFMHLSFRWRHRWLSLFPLVAHDCDCDSFLFQDLDPSSRLTEALIGAATAHSLPFLTFVVRVIRVLFLFHYLYTYTPPFNWSSSSTSLYKIEWIELLGSN